MSFNQREDQQAEVVSEHLPSGYTAEFDGATNDTSPNSTGSEQESSLKLQGGDIHRDLYKIGIKGNIKRAATFSHLDRNLPRDEPSASEQVLPGGFRREFLMNSGRRASVAIPGTRNFIEFLDLYGSFAGEDLGESDSEDESPVGDEAERVERADERRPLLGNRKSSRATRKGDAGTMKTFFTLIKAFVGTGIMFLPKAFSNGGLLFSSIIMLVVSIASAIAFHLLLQCKSRHGGGYGEIGGIIGGPKLRALILGSITLSQLGFVCAGIVFVAQNLTSFLNAVTEGGDSPLSTRALIAIQVAVLIPLAFIRNISKLGPAALIADICILIGISYIYSYDISSLAKDGIASTVQLFNPQHYTLTIGSAIFAFEGIGLVLPIQSSMEKPQHFEKLLYLVVFIITIIFTSVGVLCYMTFGSETQIEIISNYPQDSKLVNAVQFLYSVAVLVGNPVQLFPAMRILEGKSFGHLSGKRDNLTKWKKNAFRSGLVIFVGLISILGAHSLDRFVSLIGSFACIPLVYIYPPWLHYKGVAASRLAKIGDIVMIVAGVVCMVYTTVVTVKNSFV